jgi:hypothetical protein
LHGGLTAIVKKQSELYPLLNTLKKLNLKPTWENYLAVEGWDNPNRKLRAVEEMELPPQFRLRPSKMGGGFPEKRSILSNQACQ